jgi:hypothetical protein
MRVLIAASDALHLHEIPADFLRERCKIRDGGDDLEFGRGGKGKKSKK